MDLRMVSREISRVTRNYKINSHTDSSHASRYTCPGVCGNPYVNTRSSSVETFLSWSLTRDMLRAGSGISLIIFTVIPEAIHVTLTQIRDDNLETRQWIFAPSSGIGDALAEVQKNLNGETRCYLFLPERSALRSLGDDHLAGSLTPGMLRAFFPKASIMRMNSFARIAHHLVPRIIGADTHRLLAELFRTGTAHLNDEAARESLTSAAKTDSAMILRILATPARTWLGTHAKG